MSIVFSLKAKNSSGLQNLSFEPEEGLISPCLYGEYNGDEIQIDFNDLDEREVRQLISYLELQVSLLKTEKEQVCSHCKGTGYDSYAYNDGIYELNVKPKRSDHVKK